MKIERGDIFWIELSKYRPAVGSVQKPGRPGVVVSNDANNEHSQTVEIVYLTSKPKNELPTHCNINSAERPSVALCEQITTVSTEQLRDHIGRCTDAEMAEVDRCLAVSLGIPTMDYDEPTFSTNEEYENLTDIIRQMEKAVAVANARVELLQQMYNNLLERTIA